MATPLFNVESTAPGMLRVSGVISFDNAGNALDGMPLPARGGTPVTLDLKALDDSDSATLAVLIAWAARAHDAGAPFRCINTPTGLRNLATLCDVDKLLQLS
jgi:phospholipid transport system transporter-binding protein